MQAASILGRIPGYRRWSQMLPSLRKFNDREVAQERLKIIQFFDEPGEAKKKK
jgi:hypothetical protein